MHPTAADPPRALAPRSRAFVGAVVPALQRLRERAARLRRSIAALVAALIDGRARDRRLLEDVILAHHARRIEAIAVLSIGTHRATRHYETLLRGHRYVTLDRDPAMAAFGSSQQHLVGGVEDVAGALRAESFDLVVFNGVIGWGLDDAEAADRALRHLHRVLKPGGELVVGWNDRPGRRPFGPVSPEVLPSLRLFHRSLFKPLHASTVLVPGWRRHRYDFFRKPCTDAATRPSVRNA